MNKLSSANVEGGFCHGNQWPSPTVTYWFAFTLHFLHVCGFPRVSSLLPPCGSRGWNSDCQPQWYVSAFAHRSVSPFLALLFWDVVSLCGPGWHWGLGTAALVSQCRGYSCAPSCSLESGWGTDTDFKCINGNESNSGGWQSGGQVTEAFVCVCVCIFLSVCHPPTLTHTYTAPQWGRSEPSNSACYSLGVNPSRSSLEMRPEVPDTQVQHQERHSVTPDSRLAKSGTIRDWSVNLLNLG